jgi:cobalamin biosynthesis protein CobD/CbiB
MCFVNVFIGFAVIAILRTVSYRRAAEHAEKIVFSLATETLAREKLQPLRGRALSKTSIIIA